MPPSPFFDLTKALSALDVDKFQPFKVITRQYKTLQPEGLGISTDILIPKTLLQNGEPLNCPIMVRIHGGFLVTGSSRYAPWFSNWILDYAIENKAIIVSPNYRLLPEASGADIMKDMEDFWKWLHGGGRGLAQCLKEAGHSFLIPDLNKILLLGESAGGLLAVQLALSHPSVVQGVVAAYPMLDLKSPFYTEVYSKPIVGVPNIPSSVVEKHLDAVRSGRRPAVVTAADPPERLELAFSVVQNGRFLEFFGNQNPDLFPMERLESLTVAEAAELPPFFIFHGDQDSAVPAEGSRRFVSLLRERFPNNKNQLYIQDGDHGFDVDATLEITWLGTGLSMVSSTWLNSLSGLSHL